MRERHREKWRESDGEGVWVTQRKRQTDGMTRTVWYDIVLAGKMTGIVLKRF